MLPITAGSVMDLVAAAMNDTERQVYTDAAILPYMQMAYEDIKLELQDYNIPISNATSSIITIEAGMMDIGGPTGPALPADLVEIMSINERTGGTSDDFGIMQRFNFLPMTTQITAYLQVWSWQNQMVKFIGATGQVEVKLNYLASNLGEITDENTSLRLFNLKSYLAYRTAGHCAMFVGENQTRAQFLYAMGDTAKDILLSINIKSQQGIRTRRRPFRATYKSYRSVN